jgi:hypothetical protein
MDAKLALAAAAAISTVFDGSYLANGSCWQLAAVDNTSNKYIDAIVRAVFPSSAYSSGPYPSVRLWVYGSEDGTNYTYPATGADGVITLPSPHNFALLGIQVGYPGAAVHAHPMSVAAAFGGFLPRKWGIIVDNTLSYLHLANNPTIEYSGVYYTVS